MVDLECMKCGKIYLAVLDMRYLALAMFVPKIEEYGTEKDIL